ncbi:CDP-alcohol phosphatidyltransferase family protein [Schnuerera sp.]|uniref:CDP-alcohol phosphatidyltransferase family protein n=1 Tax=Schnuerera sp. TaxID=2794844 RepID=UPI002BEC214A|nr:CDP-alcohol phosphatidyltransferase family protein [Schnuerera sp.]HSH36903.1 CDP-alcohol phosphatidyltransferase family protein [Schnuerera sp.]
MIVLFSNFNNSNYIAALIFAIASATDGLDGYIARRRGCRWASPCWAACWRQRWSGSS